MVPKATVAFATSPHCKWHLTGRNVMPTLFCKLESWLEPLLLVLMEGEQYGTPTLPNSMTEFNTSSINVTIINDCEMES